MEMEIALILFIHNGVPAEGRFKWRCDWGNVCVCVRVCCASANGESIFGHSIEVASRCRDRRGRAK